MAWFTRRKLTDDEYVAWIAKWQSWKRWMAVASLLLAAAIGCLTYLLNREFDRALQLVRQVNAAPEILLILGVVLGTLLHSLGSFLFGGINLAVKDRREQLLLKYHDENRRLRQACVRLRDNLNSEIRVDSDVLLTASESYSTSLPRCGQILHGSPDSLLSEP